MTAQPARAPSKKRRPVDLSSEVVRYGFSQGPRPLCLPFAAGSAHQAERGATEPFSPESVWNTCHSRGQTTEFGTSAQAVSDALKDVGQVLLRDWPYDSTLGFETETAPDSASKLPGAKAALSALDGTHKLRAMRRMLRQGRPVIVGMEVSDEFTFVEGDAVVRAPSSIDPPQGVHAVLVVGYAYDPSGRRIYRVLNSWGDDWGDGGFTWLSAKYLRKYAVTAAVVDI